jgi:hypothetical protein
MSFNTKMYTRPVIISNLRNINARQYANLNSFTSAFSPRAGARSTKLAVLRSLIGSSNLKTVFSQTSGVSAKATLINLVKNS